MIDDAAFFVSLFDERYDKIGVASFSTTGKNGRALTPSFSSVKSTLKGLGKDVGKIVKHVSYETTDPTVDSQIIQLKDSGANVFFNITTPKFAAQAIKKAAEIGWKPTHYLNSVSNAVGSVLKPAGLENATGIISAGSDCQVMRGNSRIGGTSWYWRPWPILTCVSPAIPRLVGSNPIQPSAYPMREGHRSPTSVSAAHISLC